MKPYQPRPDGRASLQQLIEKTPIHLQVFLFTLSGLILAGTIFAAPATVLAQSANTPFAGFTKDNNVPIDIEADELEFQQNENIAIFTGKVNVIQGELRLQSARLEVRYQDVKKAGKSKREISKLNATGGVIVTSKTQTATGNWARMDVQKNIIIMGDNVVLTEGNNVIKGSRIWVDLTTGYSRVLSDKKKGGRVRAIFKPKKK